MLASLHIENIAVIKNADIDFYNGFTALTGETGAGKSILIDSIELLLGARADRDIIRTGADRALVCAMFCHISDDIISLLAENDLELDDDGNLLITRSITSDGRSQSKINGRTVSSHVLRSVMPKLISIHGQNDNAQLLNPENHLSMLDSFAENENLLAEYRVAYGKMITAKKAVEALHIDENRKKEKIIDLKKIIAVLEAAKIKVGEEDKLLADRQIAVNSERIIHQTSFVCRALKDAEKGNAVYILDRCSAALMQISDTVPQARELSARLLDIKYEIDDIADTVGDFAGGIGDDPTAALDKIESRLDKIDRLKKKFFTDEAGLLDILNKSKSELEKLENIGGELEIAECKYAEAEKNAEKAALAITKSRVSTAERIVPMILSELRFLDMEKVRFEISVEKSSALSQSGGDTVEFLISANPGELPKPIAKIASGGELARIMLAIKSVFAESFDSGTIIYDEIDAGVSGKTARKIGIKLKTSAISTQTICVTHSAQIASLANRHLLIKKNVADDSTETCINELEAEERVAEIARILGGVTISENMMTSAKELIDEGKQY